jgi:leader peptidase (prepilin peptidase) / N-methyltransferase
MTGFLYEPFIFIFGVAIGSFLNVCIHRLPQGQSIVKPASHCPHCRKSIAWYDNIPLISYLFLRGRCRHCSVKISPRYFLVELLCGLIWLFLWVHYGNSSFFYAGIVLFSLLLAVFFTDLETGYIPDKLSIPGMLAGLVVSTLWPELHNENIWYWGFVRSLVGILAGGGVLLAIAYIGNWIFKKDSMGGGDIKLLAMLGAFLGWKEAILVFLFSPIIALPFALFMKFTKKAETIPYGPYLAIMGAMFYLYGERIVQFFFYY